MGWFKGHGTKAGIYAHMRKHDESIALYKKTLTMCKQGSKEYDKYELRLNNQVNNQELAKKQRKGNQKRKHLAELSPPSPAKRQKTESPQTKNDCLNKLGGKTVYELQALLEMNGMKKSGKKADLLERVVDGMMNGQTPKCPKCNSFLKHNTYTGYYDCRGAFNVNMKRHIPCDFYSNDVKRKPWIICKYAR